MLGSLAKFLLAGFDLGTLLAAVSILSESRLGHRSFVGLLFGDFFPSLRPKLPTGVVLLA